MNREENNIIKYNTVLMQVQAFITNNKVSKYNGGHNTLAREMNKHLLFVKSLLIKLILKSN